jgi:hypothetical protein
MSSSRTWMLTLLMIAAPIALAHQDEPRVAEARGAHVPGWWKGNTHTHTWWSDGDSPPETVSEWYRERGYHFLVLSDHNRMQEGELWYKVDTDAKRTALKRYRERYGSEWVEAREKEGVTEVKLKTLDEFRTLFEQKDRFIFIRGMEITDRHHQHPVHLNGVNLERPIIPQGGDSVAQMMQKNIDAVVEQGRRSGRPMFTHVNHPNFFYAITAEDLIELDHAPGDAFVEVYNGHSGVRNDGDAFHPSTERMWDLVLAQRLGQRQTSVMYGVATDDAHHYTQWGLRQVNPGRGWVMVRAPRLTPDTITAAMKRGDFYNSTGVTLARLALSPEAIDVEVQPEPGIEYLIEFIGTKRGTDLRGRDAPTPPGDSPGRVSRLYSDQIGAVLASVKGTTARYTTKGNELYVRARVTSSRLHPNPFAEGDREMAWTQPVVVSLK